MRLTLIRHAEASNPGHPPVADFDRPLTPRGRKAFTELAADLAKILPPPDYTISSPALRTYQTASILQAAFGLPESAIYPAPDIYEAPPQRILAEARIAATAKTHLLIVGHNPGISLLAHSLSTDDALPPFSPGTIVSFQVLAESWATLDQHTCTPEITRTIL